MDQENVNQPPSNNNDNECSFEQLAQINQENVNQPPTNNYDNEGSPEQLL